MVCLCVHPSGQIGAGKGYKLTLGQFLTAYSTLGDALSPDPCGGPRAANMNFSAKWAGNGVLIIILYQPETWTKMRITRRIVQTLLFSPRLLVALGSGEGGGTQVLQGHLFVIFQRDHDMTCRKIAANC